MSYLEECLQFPRFVGVAEALEKALAKGMPAYVIEKGASGVECRGGQLDFMLFNLIPVPALPIAHGEISVTYTTETDLDNEGGPEHCCEECDHYKENNQSNQNNETLIFECDRGTIGGISITDLVDEQLEEAILKGFRDEVFDLWRHLGDYCRLITAAKRLQEVAPIAWNEADTTPLGFLERLYEHFYWMPGSEGLGFEEAKRDFEELRQI